MTRPRIVYSDRYAADIGPHVFLTSKYRGTRDALLDSGAVTPQAVVEPAFGDREVLRLAHTPEYLDDLFALRRTPATLQSELPLTEEIVRWFELAMHGSVETVRAALRDGGAMHVGGGFHHAFADRAEGFCYLNDIVAAARFALGDLGGAPLSTAAGAPVERVTVVDLDVHQGNGTARICRDDPRIFTFSMHQENNYPVKERGDLDIGLPDGLTDEPYLALLEEGLNTALGEHRPQLVIYVAGADAYREDQLGGLGLTLEGMRERDRRVFLRSAAAPAAVAVVLAGGYARDPRDTVRIHSATGEELARQMAGEA